MKANLLKTESRFYLEDFREINIDGEELAARTFNKCNMATDCCSL